jgi:ABC-2 type transport system permease protein
MRAFGYSLWLQLQMDIRNKGIVVTYYVVPLIFFAFMGGIFTSINPTSYQTLIASMSVFGVTMGALLGAPNGLIEVFGGEVRKSYLVGKIPFWSVVVSNYLSALIHLTVMCTVILVVAPIAFNATLPADLLIHYLGLLSFISASLAVGSVFGLVVRNANKLTLLSQLVFLPSVMLSGIMFPLSMLPDLMAKVGYVLPATWGYQLMSTNTLAWELLWPLLMIIGLMMVIVVVRLKQLQAPQ